MSPDEVISALSSIGVRITKRTLLNYEMRELIPKAERGGYGRGKGTFTDYPKGTVEQAFAACELLNGGSFKIPVGVLQDARKYGLAIFESGIEPECFTAENYPQYREKIRDLLFDNELYMDKIISIVYMWIFSYGMAVEELNNPKEKLEDISLKGLISDYIKKMTPFK